MRAYITLLSTESYLPGVLALHESLKRPQHFSKAPGKNGQAIKIVHFIGPRKPWMKGALIRQYWRLLKNGRAVKWEHQLFSEYKKLLADSQPAKYPA